MLLTLKQNTTLLDANALTERLQQLQLKCVVQQDNNQLSILIVNGLGKHVEADKFLSLPHVAEVKTITQKYPQAARLAHKKTTTISLYNHTIGNGELTIMAGPCSIESEQQIFETAKAVSLAGAQILRGGAFKPRTSPYDFQGLGKLGLQFMQHAARTHNLSCISEIMDANDIDLFLEYTDIIQIGARNMQNFSLLKEIGKTRKPVLLKRGLCSTYQELLCAAEYILNGGNSQVMLCERGIRTFEPHTRNTLDLNAVPVLKELSHLPVIVDPSHGTGIRKLVAPLAKAAVSVGADGLILEVHPTPDQALSDAMQTISTHDFATLVPTLKSLHEIILANQD